MALRPASLYRVSAALLVFFAVTHTYGLLAALNLPPGQAAVRAAMQSTRFPVMGMQRTYWDFYIGFGLLLTAFLLFSAALAWQLAQLAESAPAVQQRLGCPFTAVQVATAALSWWFFFPAPGVTATVIAACTLLAAGGGAVATHTRAKK